MSGLGLVLLLLAGFAQGSFGLGMKKQSPMSWESFWLIYSLFAMLFVPLIWGYASFSLFFDSIISVDSYTLLRSILLGFLWGIGGILFGMSVSYVGISITNGVVMGLAGGLGAIIPLFGIDGATKQPSFVYVIIGVVIMLLGVALSAYSGILREKEQNLKEVSSCKENNSSLIKGLVIVVLSGALSSLLNVGFEEATPIIDNAKIMGASDSASSIPARATVVFGGLLMNAGYAVFLLFRNKTWTDFKFKKPGIGMSFVWAIITGFLWFLPLGLSGIVSVSIGELGNVITWPVMLSLSLIFGNIWGYLTGEWKNTKHSFMLMILASLVLIVACMILTFKDSFIN